MVLYNAIQYIKFFLNPSNATKKLHEKIQEQRERIKYLKFEFEELSNWNDQYVAILESVTDSINALVWKKDAEYKHLLSNPTYCTVFLGQQNFTNDCLTYIIGKTSKELIEKNCEDYNIVNTFTSVVEDSDRLMEKNKAVTHFFEAGKVGEKDLLLYVIKTPEFDENGNFTGMIGVAWDITDHSEFVIQQLNRWIYSKRVHKVIHRNDVFCYEIDSGFSRCEIFSHICPNPQRGKACIKDCEKCKE